MKLVIFGLTVSSSWGNGHATIWRGLCGALARRGHRVTFFERDTSYYSAHRDLLSPHEYQLVLYPSWEEVSSQVERTLADADAAIVTSYCPDAAAASAAVLASTALKVFYDLDTPVTLESIDAGKSVEYIPPFGFRDFDLVLSYAGGRALAELRRVLGARRVAALYGSVDPQSHKPAPPLPEFCSDLSYLGTYSSDRQPALERLFLEPARRSPAKRFVIGGALYPSDFPWSGNVAFLRHVAPPQHSAFYCSSKLTLSVTRAAMAGCGYCPSGRLFEAAACGTPVVSDRWEGLGEFFEPGREIFLASAAEEVLEVLCRDPDALRQVGQRARARVLAEHTADHRAAQLINHLQAAA